MELYLSIKLIITSKYMSTEEAHFEREFFAFYYDPQNPAEGVFPPLKEKYKPYKQQSYFTPRPISEVNFVRKFQQVCQLLCFVGALKPEKIEIVLIQQVIEEVLDDFERFFAEGGWRAVKNKSNRCRLQEYLLIKLGRLFSKHRSYATLDNFVLSFFYTLNYFKTCNYQIKLFSQFLQSQADFDHFFLFIILRKRSRRHHRDLVVRSEHIATIVAVLKSEQASTAHGISLYASENDELGEVKLLLIFPQIIEYVKANEVVLHEVMIYNLMRCAGLTEQQNPLQFSKLNWTQFITSYFSQVCAISSSYPHALIQQVVTTNLKLADRVFGRDPELSCMTFSDSGEAPVNLPREKYLEESFSWLIGTLEGLIYKQKGRERWQRLYDQGTTVYESGMFVGRYLIKEMMKSAEFFDIYNRHALKGSMSVQF